MEKLIVENLCKNLKWYERVIVRLFKNTFVKVYHIGRITIFNKKLQEIKNVKEIKKDFSNLQKLINLDIEQIYSKLTLEEKRLFWVSIIEKIYINHREIKGVTFL